MMLRLMKVMVMTMLSKGRAPTNSQTLGAASCSREKYKRVDTVAVTRIKCKTNIRRSAENMPFEAELKE